MESIKVLRKQELETTEIAVGDQIIVQLECFGEFTATAQKVTDKGVLFIFDDYIEQEEMNKNSTNDGGYEKSDLKEWIDSVVWEAFPTELKNRIVGLSIPTVGEFFGHDDERFETDEDEQLPLMRERRNRVAYLGNERRWGWLRNATRREYSSDEFAYVDDIGDLVSGGASGYSGVRPEFWLKNNHREGERLKVTRKVTFETNEILLVGDQITVNLRTFLVG